MGTFSELSIDSTTGAKEEVLEVAPFTLEQNESEHTAETFGDEENRLPRRRPLKLPLHFSSSRKQAKMIQKRKSRLPRRRNLNGSMRSRKLSARRNGRPSKPPKKKPN